MTLAEAKLLKWGDYLVPSDKFYKTFENDSGKRTERGLFLGLAKDNRLRIVSEDAGTVYKYHWDFWIAAPKGKEQ